MNWITFSAIVQAVSAVAIAALTFFLVRATRQYVALTKQLAEAAARPMIAARLNLQGLVYPIVEDLKRLPLDVGMECSLGNLPSEEQMSEVIGLAALCDEGAVTNTAVAESHIAVLRPHLNTISSESEKPAVVPESEHRIGRRRANLSRPGGAGGLQMRSNPWSS